MKTLVMALVVASSLFAQASLLNLTPGNKQLENIIINSEATFQGSTTKLSLLGAGLRSKTVLFVDTKVYVLELFSTEPQNFSRNQDALKSLSNAKAVALRMTFVRNVDATTVANSYKEALVANQVSLKDPAVAGFLANVQKGGDAVQGKSLVILMYLDANGGTSLFYEDTQGQQYSLSGDRALQAKILSIWLGQPADSGLKTLKNSLLVPVY